MASAADSGDGGGDEKPPETSPGNLTSLDPSADPHRIGEAPASPSAPATMGMTGIPDSSNGGGDEMPPETSPGNITSLDPQAAPERIGEAPGMTGIPDPAGSEWLLEPPALLHRYTRRRRTIVGAQSQSNVQAPVPAQVSQQKLRARVSRQNFRQMLAGALPPRARKGSGGNLKLMLPAKMKELKKLVLPQGAQNHKLVPELMPPGKLKELKKLVLPQGAQNQSSNTAARVDVFHNKFANLTAVLTNALHEGGVLQVALKLVQLLCQDVFSATAGGGVDGKDWELVEEAIDNLVNQIGDGIQDIVKTVAPKVFSKGILYDLMTRCVGRYAQLLANDKGKLTTENYDRYNKQLDLMIDLTVVYEEEPENFSRIMKLMCKIGGCGPLPTEVIDDISPGHDPSTIENLYSEMAYLLYNVDRA